jgi:Domain of unknown function (DUF5753)
VPVLVSAMKAPLPTTVLAAGRLGPSDHERMRLSGQRRDHDRQLVNGGRDPNRTDHPAEFTALIDEAAFRRRVGGAEVMLQRLKYLKDRVATWENVSLHQPASQPASQPDGADVRYPDRRGLARGQRLACWPPSAIASVT